MLRVIMMGPPGVGKGTQAALLAADLGVPAISTGDLFREHERSGTPLGIHVRTLLSSGSYVPDDITNQMVAKRLSEPDVQEGFILDGYPRTLPQVTFLDTILANAGHSIDVAVLLNADDDDITERLMRRARDEGRHDDQPETISRRIAVYAAETAPLADEYESRGVLRRVPGWGSRQQVQESIRNAVT